MNFEGFVELLEKRERKAVPGMEGCFIQAMTWDQQVAAEDRHRKKPGEFLPWAIAYGLVDEEGKRIIEDKDVPRLKKMIPSPVLQRLYKLMQSVNELTDKEMESLEGESSADRDS